MAIDLRSTAVHHRKSLIFTLSIILLLRSRLLKLPQDVARKITNARAQNKLTPEELALALQQVYVEEPDGSKSLLVPYREGVSKVCPPA